MKIFQDFWVISEIIEIRACGDNWKIESFLPFISHMLLYCYRLYYCVKFI